MKKPLLAAVVLCAHCALSFAAELPLFHGDPGSDQFFDKIITIKPDAKWVNVMSGDTVKFIDATTGKSFVWSFAIPNFATFDLVAVAPRGVISHEHLTVYVSQNVRNTDDP